MAAPSLVTRATTKTPSFANCKWPFCATTTLWWTASPWPPPASNPKSYLKQPATRCAGPTNGFWWKTTCRASLQTQISRRLTICAVRRIPSQNRPKLEDFRCTPRAAAAKSRWSLQLLPTALAIRWCATATGSTPIPKSTFLRRPGQTLWWVLGNCRFRI